MLPLSACTCIPTDDQEPAARPPCRLQIPLSISPQWCEECEHRRLTLGHRLHEPTWHCRTERTAQSEPGTAEQPAALRYSTSNEYRSFITNSRARNKPYRGRTSSRNFLPASG